MDNIVFQHDDWMKVCLPIDIYKTLVSYCQRAGIKETGGILIGHYTDDLSTAIITEATGAPADSLKKRFSFFRGTSGIEKILNSRWPEKRYYIGEWHYHPSSSANPSDLDIEQIHKFSHDKNLKCPEPIMIIVGGNSILGWKLSVHVSRQGNLLQLNSKVAFIG